MSAADLVAVLVARNLRIDAAAPDELGNDRLLFSKGHASPLLYATLEAMGVLDEQLEGFDDPVDAYRQPYIPFYLATREFFQLARDRLTPGGMLAIPRWLKLPPRDSLKLFLTALVALERQLRALHLVWDAHQIGAVHLPDQVAEAVRLARQTPQPRSPRAAKHAS